MNEERMHSMQGQLDALAMTLSSVMLTLQPLTAAQAAVNLRFALEDQKNADHEEQIPPAQVNARNAIADTFCDLLSTVSQAD